MEDTSFLSFTEDSIIDKIDIDPRLIDSFKRVMKKIQNYFNANGYTSQRNYKEYLERFLLNSGEQNMRFYINKIDPVNVGGFYNKHRHEICINEDILNRSIETLDSTLCHEFIHFLVMHNLEVGKADPNIIGGGFINEALTEMLTQQMYPTSRAYDAQVSMQKFANLVSSKTNNFSKFLQGFIDARYSSHDWENFIWYANNFQNDFNKAGYINLGQAQTNENFIKAQRRLISLFICHNGKITIDEYIDSIKKLIDRPVKDSEYINNTIVSQLDKTLISSLGLKDTSLKEFLQQKLNELRDQIVTFKQYEGKQIYEFDFEGRKFTLDGNYNLHGNLVGMSRSWSPRNGIMTLILNGKKLILNVNELDFGAREREITQKIKELSSYFSKEASKDLSFISQAAKGNGKLTKIEKFTIPVFDSKTKQKSATIYVATYEDRIVILNNASKICNIENLDLNKYIGMTSTNPNVAAIYSDKLGSIEKGIIYSVLTSKAVERRAIALYANQLENLLSQEQLNLAIQEYRNSEDYTEDTEENIRYEAIMLLAEKRFNSLNDEEKNKLFESVKKQNNRFVISTTNGKIDVSYVFGDKNQTAYRGSSEVLYDSKGTGMYNEVYDSISKNIVPEINNSQQSIPIDSNGNIIFSEENINKEADVSQEYYTIQEQKEKILEWQRVLHELQDKAEVFKKNAGYYNGNLSQEEKQKLDDYVNEQIQNEMNRIFGNDVNINESIDIPYEHHKSM